MNGTFGRLGNSISLRWKLLHVLGPLLGSSLNKQKAANAIRQVADLCNLDLLEVVHQGLGIGLPVDFGLTGERFLIESVLKKYVRQHPSVFFDVGANVGDYSKELRRAFPAARIYAFEPNINAFE